MKRIHVSELLTGRLSPEQFQQMYAVELEAHLQLLQKKGASAPVILVGDEPIFVDRANFLRLLECFSVGFIRKEMLRYVLDALTLDSTARFASGDIREMVMDLADEDFGHEEIESILARLDGN